MRPNINLASHPYEDARSFYMQWLPLLIVLTAIAALLSTFAYSRYMSSHEQDRELNEIRSKIAKLEETKQQANATLNLPQNSGTRDQAQFLNSLFVRKAFSWTQVLSDLEQIMPRDIKVTSITPKVNENGLIEFTVKVSTRKRDTAIELVRRMEASKRFGSAQVKSENAHAEAKSSATQYDFDIAALYEPALQKAAQ
jgi:type IV pilus assembly protein PilN